MSRLTYIIKEVLVESNIFPVNTVKDSRHKAEETGDCSMTLSELGIGNKAKIVSVHGHGALRGRLLDMGLTPRTMVMIRKTAPMGDPIELTLRSYELTLRMDDAKNIEVERVD